MCGYAARGLFPRGFEQRCEQVFPRSDSGADATAREASGAMNGVLFPATSGAMKGVLFSETSGVWDGALTSIESWEGAKRRWHGIPIGRSEETESQGCGLTGPTVGPVRRRLASPIINSLIRNNKICT